MISRNRIAAALCLALMASPAAADARVPKDFVGIDSQDTFQFAFNNDTAGADRNLAAQAATGIHIHRQPFTWETIETSPGTYDFSATDRYMERIAASGMRVLPVLFDAPDFHNKKRDNPTANGIFSPPKNGKVLGKFGAALIKRYGPKGSFWRGKPGKFKRNSAIRSWQLWNEPNLRFYWGGRPNAKQYVKVLKQAYRIMKRADGKAEIVTAGMPESSTKRAIGLKKYITQMYKAGGKKWFDTIAVNAYAKNTKDLNRRIKLVRKVMKKRGDKKAELWITEIGWADAGKKGPFVKSPKGQAREIKKAIAWIGKNRKRHKLRGFVYYQWRDALPYRAGIDADTWGFHAGLLKLDGSFKRAHKAFKKAVANL